MIRFPATVRADQKDGKVEFAIEHETSFWQLREAIATEAILGLPDQQKPLEVESLASNFPIGRHLRQCDDNEKLHYVAFSLTNSAAMMEKQSVIGDRDPSPSPDVLH